MYNIVYASPVKFFQTTYYFFSIKKELKVKQELTDYNEYVTQEEVGQLMGGN